jgi:hypothetical protein
LYPPPFGVVKELSDTISRELIFLILRRGDENRMAGFFKGSSPPDCIINKRLVFEEEMDKEEVGTSWFSTATNPASTSSG